MQTLKDGVIILLFFISLIGSVYMTLISFDSEAERYFDNQQGKEIR